MSLAMLPTSAETACYMVTSTGQKVSLGGLCSKQSSPTVSPRNQFEFQAPSSTQSRQTVSSNDHRVQQGIGGYEDPRTGAGQSYHYEVWSNRANTRYTLKVWRLEDYPNGSAWSQTFRSGREALDHFDCHYARKRLPSCSYS